MSFIFNNIFYKPLLNALGFLTSIIPGHSFGLAIILLTLMVNLLLLPLTHRMKRSQKKLQELEPHLTKIKKQFKDRKEEQARRMMDLYREHGVNPFSGFVALIIQVPIFIALFKVFRQGAQFPIADLYSFMPLIPEPNLIFLGLIDLSTRSIILALLAGVSQLIQGQLLAPQPGAAGQGDFGRMMQLQFRYMLPAVIFLAGLSLPAGFALYLITMSIFGIMHEWVLKLKARYGTAGENIQPGGD